MSEILARALGAGSKTVTIAGKECKVRSLGLMELAEVERECLRCFRRSYLETFSNNIDLLPDGRGFEILERKMEEVAKWDIGSLPPKHAYDGNSVLLVESLKEWVCKTFSVDQNTSPDNRLKALVASAMDQGMLSEDKYKELTGFDAPKIKIPYVSWWITGNFEGMIYFTWSCFRDQGISKEQIAEAMRGDMSLLVDLVREIEHLSAPKVGNG